MHFAEPQPTTRDRVAFDHADLVGYELLFEGEGPFLDDELSAVAERARRALGSERAMVNILTPDLQMTFDSAGGFAEATPRPLSMCHHTLPWTDGQGLFVIEDARTNPTLADLPWVNGEWTTVRFYAIAAIVGPSGVPIGTVCCFGSDRRTATEEERVALRDCADTALEVLRSRRATANAAGAGGAGSFSPAMEIA